MPGFDCVYQISQREHAWIWRGSTNVGKVRIATTLKSLNCI